MQKTTTPWLAVIVGTLMLATVPIIVRQAQAEHMPSLSIAALRLMFGALILTPYVLARHATELRQLTRREFGLMALAGIGTTLFFVFFFSSLTLTSVLIAGVMTATNPLWVAFMEVAFLKNRLNRNIWVGLALVLVGSALFSLAGLGGGIELGTNPLMGGLLALLAAGGTATYFTLGRVVRARVSAFVFVWVALLAGSIFATFMLVLTQSALTGFSTQGYIWVLLMTLGAQVIGQVSLIYALAHIPATRVAIVLQFSVVISAVLAVFAFQEQPDPLQIVASVVILAGVIRVIVRA